MTASIYTLAVAKRAVSTNAATVSLFTVVGGRVLVQLLYGNVTTTLGAGAATLQFNSNPTVGADSPLSTASAPLTLAAAGTLIAVTGLVGAAPLVSVGQGGVSGQATPLIIQPGAIEVIVAVGDATGVIDYFCLWMPLDPNAVLGAA